MKKYHAKRHPGPLIGKVVLQTALFGIILSACSSRASDVPRLRITNSGTLPINSLVVFFPEESIAFGDIPAGATTEYVDVPKGIYSYAAYEFEVDGQVVTQPVIDWIGESPMGGKLFTYTIDFDPARVNTGDSIRLLDVQTDD